jgi:hypothetical protein
MPKKDEKDLKEFIQITHINKMTFKHMESISFSIARTGKGNTLLPGGRIELCMQQYFKCY